MEAIGHTASEGKVGPKREPDVPWRRVRSEGSGENTRAFGVCEGRPCAAPGGGNLQAQVMFERDRYLYEGKTFAVDLEGKEEILRRHRAFTEERCLQVNNRIPYVHSIWKSAKRNPRRISGIKKESHDDVVDGVLQGSIARAGKELVPLLGWVMQALRHTDNDGRRQGKPKGVVESVEEVTQPCVSMQVR